MAIDTTPLFDKIVNSIITHSGSVDLLGFAFQGEYHKTVSCTHNAPQGEKTNWSADKTRPRHFPGIVGRVWLRVYEPEGTNPFWFSHIERDIQFYHGGGGTGSYDGPWNYSGPGNSDPRIVLSSYSAYAFLDDFPEMQVLEDEWSKLYDEEQKHEMLRRMKNNVKSQFLLKNLITVSVDYLWEKS